MFGRFQLRRNFWRTKAHAFEKLRMLHMRLFPVLSWCAASCLWKVSELAVGRTMQLRMGRGGVKLMARCRRAHCDIHGAHSDMVLHLARRGKSPALGRCPLVCIVAVERTFRVTCPEPENSISEGIQWRDATCREARLAMLWREIDLG